MLPHLLLSFTSDNWLTVLQWAMLLSENHSTASCLSLPVFSPLYAPYYPRLNWQNLSQPSSHIRMLRGGIQSYLEVISLRLSWWWVFRLLSSEFWLHVVLQVLPVFWRNILSPSSWPFWPLGWKFVFLWTVGIHCDYTVSQSETESGCMCQGCSNVIVTAAYIHFIQVYREFTDGTLEVVEEDRDS
jgi:hypothetical protein